ncbi:MAG: 3'-5' exonuclease [Myxococcota bacterium]
MSAAHPIHYVVVDLEATCWSLEADRDLRLRQSEECEIIEIGAVALDADLTPLDEFQTFVRPVRHPILSAFCTRLTSITQQDVDPATTFPSAYAAFVSWMGGHTDGLTFVSWSRWDHRQLARECRLHQIPHPLWHPVDAKLEFTEWARAKTGLRLRYGLARTLEYLNIPFSGTAHRGIDDARNLVQVFQHIRDLGRISDGARRTLAVMLQRDPTPTHVGHLKSVDANARQWFPRVKEELIRLGLAEDTGLGRGLVLTDRGRGAVTSGKIDLTPTGDP